MKLIHQEAQGYTIGLADKPQYIHAYMSGVPDAQLHWSPDTNTWSAFEIFTYIRACSEIRTFNIYATLVENEPMLPDIDEHQWAKIVLKLSGPFSYSFEAYSRQRSELARNLLELSPTQWERTATIAGLKHSVFTQVKRMIIHENEHLEQLKSILGKA